MSAASKDWIAKWLPLILAILSGWAMFFTFKATTEAQLQVLRDSTDSLRTELMPMDKRVATFVPRVEFTAVVDSLHREMSDVKSTTHETNVLVREMSREIYQVRASKKNPGD